MSCFVLLLCCSRNSVGGVNYNNTPSDTSGAKSVQATVAMDTLLPCSLHGTCRRLTIVVYHTGSDTVVVSVASPVFEFSKLDGVYSFCFELECADRVVNTIMMPDTNHLQNDVIPNHIGEVRMVPSVILPHSRIEVTYVLSSKAQQQVLGQYPEENMAIAIPTFSWNRRLFGSALEHRSHQSSLPDFHISLFDSTDNKAKELLSLMFTDLNDSQKVVARERIRRTYAK